MKLLPRPTSSACRRLGMVLEIPIGKNLGSLTSLGMVVGQQSLCRPMCNQYQHSSYVVAHGR